MPVIIKSLDGDKSLLLTFTPSIAPPGSSRQFPGSFVVLVDPWLTKTAQILSPKFSLVEKTAKPCISSLAELLPALNLVIVSQDKPDHCHEETLRQLPSSGHFDILASAPAAKRIAGWKHFDKSMVTRLSKFAPSQPHTIFRAEIPPYSSTGLPGEVTVAVMPARLDLSGLHSAVGITYKPPSSVLAASPTTDVRSPAPSAGNPSISGPISVTRRTLSSSKFIDREKALSVIYSPHGVPYECLQAYVTSHLIAEAALPLTVLLHPFDRVENPWYLGGTITTGLPGGVEIAQKLLPGTWISTHDGDKVLRGFSVSQTKIKKFSPEEVKKRLEGSRDTGKQTSTRVISLEVGEEVRILAPRLGQSDVARREEP